MTQKKKHHVWAIFNKSNGAFTGFSLNANITTSGVDIYRLESDEPINLTYLTWEGDFKTGRAVDTSKSPQHKDVVSEAVLEDRKYERLFRKYPPSKIICLLLDQMEMLVHAEVIPEKDLLGEFTELLEYYGKVDAKFTKDIMFFQRSDGHNFVTKEQEMEKFNEAFSVETAPPEQ